MTATRKVLVLGLPKGSLQVATSDLMKKAGFTLRVADRSYFPSVDDEELKARLIRPQDMSRYVEKGVVDAGITGKDWVEENASDVVVVQNFLYAKQSLTPVRWVLAVPEDSPARTLKDLQGKRIATELVNVTKKFLARQGVSAHVEFSHGATEVKAPDLVDAIVELTETGNSLRAHNLRIVETVMESITQMIANRASWRDPWKRKKMENLAILLEGALIAREKVGLKLNVSKKCLKAVLRLLPAMKKPTISPLAAKGWFALETMVDERTVRQLVPELKRAGAEGIIEYPLNKVIP
jgi:ATP phosphoribosyltransferase